MAHQTHKALKPSTAYRCCPACRSKNLIRLEVDALCADCDWDSTFAFVQAGGMDNLFAAAIDHFGSVPEHERINEAVQDEIFETAETRVQAIA